MSEALPTSLKQTAVKHIQTRLQRICGAFRFLHRTILNLPHRRSNKGKQLEQALTVLRSNIALGKL
jgi:hypothetical protein